MPPTLPERIRVRDLADGKVRALDPQTPCHTIPREWDHEETTVPAAYFGTRPTRPLGSIAPASFVFCQDPAGTFTIAVVLTS